MQVIANKSGSLEMDSISEMGAMMTSSDSEAAAMKVERRSSSSSSPYEVVRQLGSCNAVVVFSMSGCCMCTVVKHLLFSLGAGPTIIEVDQHVAGPDIQAVLYELAFDRQQPLPAVFVGGKFLGGVEPLMAYHINGNLVPLLKDSGALWL